VYPLLYIVGYVAQRDGQEKDKLMIRALKIKKQKKEDIVASLLIYIFACFLKGENLLDLSHKSNQTPRKLHT
jgi:hypothetical protein